MRVGYFISETVTNLRRNLLMSIAAVSTVAISLLLLGGVQILGMVVGNMTQSWEAKVEVSVFLLDNITDGEREGLINTLHEHGRSRGRHVRLQERCLRGVQGGVGRPAGVLREPAQGLTACLLASEARRREVFGGDRDEGDR